MTMKHARQLQDLTQAQMADLLGVHRHTYMNWERNPEQMPLGKAKEFAKITNKSVDDIFFTGDSTLSR